MSSITSSMESFWQHHKIGPFPTLSGYHRCDIAIIGAGYTGSWLAYWLRNSGLKVMLLESQTPGFGASGRNGGLLLQGPAQLLAQSSESIGRVEALDLWQHTRETFSWVAELARRYPLDYHTTGSLYVGAADERALIESTVALMNQAGSTARVVLHQKLPPSLQRLGLDAAAWFPDDGTIHPLKLLEALLTEASLGGVAIFSRSPVSRVDANSNQAILTGQNFTVHAAKVLVVTNAYVPEWLPAMAQHIHPVRGQILATEPTEPLDHHVPVYADHGFNYWHQREDGRIVAGGYRHLDLEGEVGTDLLLNPDIQNRLTDLVATLAGHPLLIHDRWAGIMAMSDDHLPYVGMLTGTIGVAIGYSGHGSTVTPIAAKMLRDQVIDGSPVFPPLSVARILNESDTRP